MKLALLGYRKWALNAFSLIQKEYPMHDYTVITNPDEVGDLEDCVVLGAGWSWLISNEFLAKNEMVALVHPSDLPEYAGGTPIQHQILDGLLNTKATLFEVTNKLDAGPIIYKTDFSLSGSMDDIFVSLTKATMDLFSNFLDNYPDIPRLSQKVGMVRKRLTPDQSQLSADDFKTMSVFDIYNHIRCREYPYPNAYIEDHSGRLYFSNVRFEKSE